MSSNSPHQQAIRTLPAPKSDFIGLRGVCHLASGGEPPLLVSHRLSFEQFAADKAAGYDGYHRHWQVAAAVRRQLASLMMAQTDEIALTSNASQAIADVVGSINWQAGDNVVVSSIDYASGRYALANLQRHGVELRLVKPDGWFIDSDTLLANCDHRTRLLYVSQVTSLTGQHLPIGSISAALENTATTLLVDASHALGVLPVHADLADFTVASCYKFALGVHDGVLAWNRNRQADFQPASVGWASAAPAPEPGHYQLNTDATRIEYGNVNHLGTYLLHESLDYLSQFGIDAIAKHARNLSGMLIDGMLALGLPVITPTDANQRGASAAFTHNDATIVQRVASQDILIWADSGRVRASAHLFCSRDDVLLLLRKLPELLRDDATARR